MSWGNSFAAGFEVTSRARLERKRQAADERRGEVERDLRQRALDSDAQKWKEEREQRDRLEAARNALLREQLDGVAARYGQERTDREADPTNRLNRAKAELELATLSRPSAPPAPPDELADLTRQRDIAQRKREIAAISAPAAQPAPPPPPMAKVTQKMGDTTVVRDMPATDLERGFGALGYKSPHEEDVAELDRQIAEQQAEMAGGDMRTGFLGVGSSRQDIVAKANRQRLALKARELQDMLERGVIDQAEADRRAALLMQQ